MKKKGVIMMKKITHLILIGFCINTVFPILAESLTKREADIYDKIIWEYRFGSIRSTGKFDKFLKKENLSPEELYAILQKKDFAFSSKAISFFERLLPEKQRYYASNPVAGAGAVIPVIGSLFFTTLGATLLALSSAVSYYISPSKSQKFISSSLKNLGIASLVPEALIEFYGEGIITGVLLPRTYKRIIPDITRKEVDDLEISPRIIKELEYAYPQLAPKSKSTFL